MDPAFIQSTYIDTAHTDNLPLSYRNNHKLER